MGVIITSWDTEWLYCAWCQVKTMHHWNDISKEWRCQREHNENYYPYGEEDEGYPPIQWEGK